MKALFADWLNGFSFSEIPIFFLELAIVVLFSMLIAWVGRKKHNGYQNRYFPVLGMLIYAGTTMSKLYMPFALLMVGVFFFMTPHFKQESKEQSMYLLLILILSVGAGIGSMILTLLAVIIALAYLWVTPAAKK